MNNPNEADVVEFQKSRQHLLGVNYQKQQLELQSNALKLALGELSGSANEKVFKAVGNILIQKNASDVKKELEESKETVDLRLKTLQKQEETLVSKLNKLRSRIEGKSESGAEEEPEKKNAKKK